MPARPAILGEGLVSRRIVVASADVLLVKAMVDAHEGVAALFAERGGELTLASPVDRARELDELVAAIEELVADRARSVPGARGATRDP